MPEAVRVALIAFSLTFVAVGGYYRIRSQQSGERLDRTKEGWPILIGIRLLGLLTVGSTTAWLWNPALFEWASWPIQAWARWIGVAGFACAAAWLMWMFHALGRNLTDTVVTRRDAHFVDHGPYRFVRNPMYTGILMLGMSLGLALGTWLLPVAASLMFTLLTLRTRTEEKYLIERFGDQYRNYMKRVGRFFPKPPS
jgi:protein-S-isoprenylcysteine O-methyltransferase Ste14